MIALGEDRAGTQAFYESLKTSMAVKDSEMMSTNSTEICEPNAPIFPNSDSEYDSAEDNLDTLINILQKDTNERNELMQNVSQLCCSFVDDVCKRIK